MPTAMYDVLVTKLTTDLGIEEKDIRPDATFADLEIDSLAALELGVILEEDLGIKFDLDELRRQDMTLEQFAGHVDGLVAGRRPQAAETS
ncbi:acyl carrier protein [Streptomyces sp. NPDC016845]|uniref:acyl carrier protein n=1 Tax=Streptomyces sp. NPDC016845 TaxID=3364972 RepID=UPI0037B64D8B